MQAKQRTNQDKKIRLKQSVLKPMLWFSGSELIDSQGSGLYFS